MTAPSESALEVATRALDEMPALTAADGDVEVIDDLEEISAETLARQGEEAPVIKLVNVVLMSAISKGASDIHIEPYEKEYRIRYRIDGILYNIMSPPLKMRDAITSRIKIMAKLDIAEKRLPQDGRIKIRFSDNGSLKDIDFRVSCLPTLFGEKIVMRLLDKSKLMLDMTKLGFEEESLQKLETRHQQAVGHGAGHRSDRQRQDQHALLLDLAASTRTETNIMTAEDPVEFNLPGVNQVQVRENIGLNFAAALRSFLRQDPNIILVGEIRDFETAEIAVKAALTGHLVLSTLHTNDAPEHDQPPDEHGHRAVPGRQLAQSGVRAASGAPRVQPLQGRGSGGAAGARADRLQPPTTRAASSRSKARVAKSATRPATRAASVCTK